MAMMKTGISSPPLTTTDTGNVNQPDPQLQEQVDEWFEEDAGSNLQQAFHFDFERYENIKDKWAKWDERLAKTPENLRPLIAAEIERRKDQAVDEVFEFYRNVWGFPFPLKDASDFKPTGDAEFDAYVSGMLTKQREDDIKKYVEQAKRLRDFESRGLLVGYVPLDGDSLFEGDTEEVRIAALSRELEWNALGIGVANAWMPHLHKCPVKGMVTPFDGFWGNGPKAGAMLKKAIKLALRFDSGAEPHSIRYGLRSIGGIQSVGNFKPTVAKFLWEWYTPAEGGIVYDYSSGWGGRLTGARSSKKNITYVGVDPSHETFDQYAKLDAFISQVYGQESGTITTNADGYREYRTPHAWITQIGSELFCPPELYNKVDFAFSSPPYFDLEQYGGNDPTQSHVKYPGSDLWLTGFIHDTAANIFKMLKPGSFAGVNIADFRDTKICDGVIQMYEKVGFKYRPDENYYMRISVRTGNRTIEKNVTTKDDGSTERKKHKTETIFMFQKP